MMLWSIEHMFRVGVRTRSHDQAPASLEASRCTKDCDEATSLVSIYSRMLIHLRWRQAGRLCSVRKRHREADGGNGELSLDRIALWGNAGSCNYFASLLQGHRIRTSLRAHVDGKNCREIAMQGQ